MFSVASHLVRLASSVSERVRERERTTQLEGGNPFLHVLMMMYLAGCGKAFHCGAVGKSVTIPGLPRARH